MKVVMNSSLISFLYYTLLDGQDLYSIMKEQYELAKRGISITESNKLSDLERKALIALVLEDKKNESDILYHSMKS